MNNVPVMAYVLQVARSFRPDFVLIRQAARDGSRDFRSILLGLKYGGVPCINSLNSVYQFQVNAEKRIESAIELTK